MHGSAFWETTDLDAVLVAHPIPLPIQDKPLLVDDQASKPPPAKKAGLFHGFEPFSGV